MTNKEFDQLFNLINKSFSGLKWFIAGGSLNPGQSSDIDVYFYTEQDLNSAIEYFKTLEGVYSRHETSNAVTFYHEATHTDIQLIKANIGTPEQVLSTFDLNKSCIYIDLDKKTHKLYNYNDPLTVSIKNLRTSTPVRFFKYIYRKGFTVSDEDIKLFIDYLLEDGYGLLPSSYDEDEDRTKLYCLYKAIITYNNRLSSDVLDYYNSRIQELYPEVLI